MIAGLDDVSLDDRLGGGAFSRKVTDTIYGGPEFISKSRIPQNITSRTGARTQSRPAVAVLKLNHVPTEVPLWSGYDIIVVW